MSVRTAPHAALQRRALLALGDSPARSVVDLARRVDATRPSTSRALHGLLERDLVARQGRAWNLTVAGRQERNALAHDTSEAVAEAARVVRDRVRSWQGPYAAALGAMSHIPDYVSLSGRIGAMGQLKALDGAWLATDYLDRLGGRSAYDAARQLAESPLLASFTAARLDDVVAPKLDQDTASMLDSQAGASLYDRAGVLAADTVERMDYRLTTVGQRVIDHLLHGALGSAVKSQQRLLDSISRAATTDPWWRPMVAEMLTPSSRIVADLAGIEALLGSRRRAVRDHGPMLAALAGGVVAAHADYMPDALAELSDADPSLDAGARRLVLPTRATADYVRSARSLLEPQGSAAPPFDIDSRPLAIHLRPISPPAADAWLGAVEQLHRRGPGWVRLAAHGLREAVRLLLERLTPDVPTQDGRITRATRVAYILDPAGGKLGHWGVTIQQAIIATYPVLADEAHHQHEQPRLNPMATVGMFRATEGLLYVLISYAPGFVLEED